MLNCAKRAPQPAAAASSATKNQPKTNTPRPIQTVPGCPVYRAKRLLEIGRIGKQLVHERLGHAVLAVAVRVQAVAVGVAEVARLGIFDRIEAADAVQVDDRNGSDVGDLLVACHVV